MIYCTFLFKTVFDFAECCKETLLCHEKNPAIIPLSFGITELANGLPLLKNVPNSTECWFNSWNQIQTFNLLNLSSNNEGIIFCWVSWWAVVTTCKEKWWYCKITWNKSFFSRNPHHQFYHHHLYSELLLNRELSYVVFLYT